MNSAIYTGKVFHARHIPKQHKFAYDIYLMWLDLDELDALHNSVRGFSIKGFAPIQFRRTDYLGDPSLTLKQCVLERMSELAGAPLNGKVFMLGQCRTFGMYFSPVNFYYLQSDSGHYTHMLAEVSNTPWDERHHYLVDLDVQADDQKVFHVSPFNPMDMTYSWRVTQPGEHLKLQLSCVKNDKHFDAVLNMRKNNLNSTTVRNVVLSIPSMAIKTVTGIYWQALKLFLKRVPFYGHPVSK